MSQEAKSCWSFLAACAFAVWGAFLNGWITSWLWDWHRFDFSYAPFQAMFLGLLLGFITAYVFSLRNPQFALRSGYIFVFIVIASSIADAKFIMDPRDGNVTRLLLCFDNYGFSFLWALSLIVAGYFLHTAERHSRRDKTAS